MVLFFFNKGNHGKPVKFEGLYWDWDLVLNNAAIHVK